MTSAIIVAAGRGTRMGPGQDKLFLEIAGQPVIAHTWRKFEASAVIDEIVLVIRADLEQEFQRIAELCGFAKKHRFAIGGAERQDSVWNGLQTLDSRAEIVAIHDGARPCVSGKLIADTVRAAREHGAAVAAQRITDTIKESLDGLTISRTLDRSKLWSVQTPQSFQVPLIRHAIEVARERGLQLTDDTAACELIGRNVVLVESRQPNPKVTLPADLPYIGSLLGDRKRWERRALRCGERPSNRG